MNGCYVSAQIADEAQRLGELDAEEMRLSEKTAEIVKDDEKDALRVMEAFEDMCETLFLVFDHRRLSKPLPEGLGAMKWAKRHWGHFDIPTFATELMADPATFGHKLRACLKQKIHERAWEVAELELDALRKKGP